MANENSNSTGKGWGNVGGTMNGTGRVAPLGESNARLRNYLRSAAHVETEIAPQESLEKLATACKGETIVLMLATDKATEECVETLLTSGFEGTLVNCATLSPDCVQRLSSKCNDASVLTAKPMKLVGFVNCAVDIEFKLLFADYFDVSQVMMCPTHTAFAIWPNFFPHLVGVWVDR